MIKDEYIIPEKMQRKKHKKSRFIELDFLRGFAIAHMIILHLLWDLNYYGIFNFFPVIQKTNIIVQIMFFTIVGICLSIGFNKTDENKRDKLYLHLLKRGAWIFSLGLVITAVTLVFMPDRPIILGVLHCIGLCIILSIPFLKFQNKNIIIANILIISGIIIGSFNFQNPTLLHLLIGFHPADLWTYTIDYFPLLPWLGVTLLGVSIGNILYSGNERRFKLPDLSVFHSIRFVSWLGRNSLIIYLIHQPFIVAVLTLYLII